MLHIFSLKDILIGNKNIPTTIKIYMVSTSIKDLYATYNKHENVIPKHLQ